MRSNALLKQEYVQDNARPAAEPWEQFRARIAKASQDACAQTGPDLGEFEEKYAGASFA